MPKLKTKVKIPLDTNQTLKGIMNNQMMNSNLPKTAKEKKQSLSDMLKNLPQNQKAATKRPTQRANQVNQVNQANQVNQVQANQVNKENLIMRVIKYQTSKRFGPTLKKDLKINFTRDTLARKTPDQIELILHRIRTFLNSRNLDAVFEHMATTCAIGYEKTVSPFYNIDGFSHILLQNPDFWDCLERWKIERELPNIPPHLQMLYIVASTTITAHEFNKMNLPKPQPQPQPKPQPQNDMVIIDKDDEKTKEKERTKFTLNTVI